MAKAVYAGILGRKVADKVGYANAEEGFICSLFRNLGEILIAYYSPEDITEYGRGVFEELARREEDNEKRSWPASYEEIGMIIAGRMVSPRHDCPLHEKGI